MGAHSDRSKATPGVRPGDIEVLHLQVIRVTDRSQIICWATCRAQEGVQSRHVGNALVEYDLLSLPAMGQVMYALGAELKGRWAAFGRTS